MIQIFFIFLYKLDQQRPLSQMLMSLLFYCSFKFTEIFIIENRLPAINDTGFTNSAYGSFVEPPNPSIIDAGIWPTQFF
jgi:hypothetical protein